MCVDPLDDVEVFEVEVMMYAGKSTSESDAMDPSRALSQRVIPSGDLLGSGWQLAALRLLIQKDYARVTIAADPLELIVTRNDFGLSAAVVTMWTAWLSVTESPVNVTDGTNILARVHKGKIIEAARTWLDRFFCSNQRVGRPPPLWNDRAAERIVEVLSQSKAMTCF